MQSRPSLPPEPAGGVPARSVERCLWRPEPVPPPRSHGTAGLRGLKIAVLGGDALCVRSLADALAALGAEAACFDPRGDDPELEARAFCLEFGPMDGIVDLNVAGPFSSADNRAWEPPLRRTVSLLKALYGDWARETGAGRLFYVAVTRMGGWMGRGRDGRGGEDVYQPLGGIWAGLAKSLPREIANCNVRIVDFCPRSWGSLNEILPREIGDWGFFEIGYRQGRRYALVPAREPPPAPSRSIGPDFTLVLSGGGRGIGFALARSLAADHGCRVAVTGRIPLEDLSSEWAGCSAADFKRGLDDLLKEGFRDRDLVRARREAERRKRGRELKHNLDGAVRLGLRIEYLRCDITSPGDVADLAGRFDWPSCGLIHNAGVDSPMRLGGKQLDDFVRTVEVKISGFLHLWQALKGRRPAFWCNVGSLTGRWGGMVGQVDYGAANEGLARLGLWASAQSGYPVKTLCWPTWERLGMISNYDATLKYMSPLNVEEGVDLWRQELVTCESGEITFMGTIGQALSPVLLKGYPPAQGIPGIGALRSRLYYLGEVVDFRPFRSLCSRNTLSAGSTPALFASGPAPSFTVGLLLEFALSLGEWVVPEGWDNLVLEEIRDLRVHLPAMAFGPEPLVMEKEGTGEWRDDRWRVEIRMDRMAPGGDRVPLARMHLLYAKLPPEAEKEFRREDGGGPAMPFPSLEGGPWQGRLFKAAEWVRDGLGIKAEVEPCLPGDLWALPDPPELRLPLAAVENILWAARGGSTWKLLKLSRFRLFARMGTLGGTVRGRPGRPWSIGMGPAIQALMENPEYA